MSGVGAKLSRHVLGMKFMRKTKNQIDKERTEKVHRQHFENSTSKLPTDREETARGIKNESTTTSNASSSHVEELWSYNQCEHYIFGRQSFGGFNLAVEKSVKTGAWKPFYLPEQCEPEDDNDNTKGAEVNESQSDVDVSDQEMAKTYGSLIGTLAKRFRKKHSRNQNSKKDHNVGKQKGSARAFYKNKGKKEKNDPSDTQAWKANKKRQRESTGSVDYSETKDWNSTPKNNIKREHGDDLPPNKRRKFLKPRDD